MFPIIFKLGPFTLHTYGLMVALGFLAGFAWAKKEFKAYGLDLTLLDSLLTLLMLSGLLGARVFYFATEKFQPLFADPMSFFRIWEGGLVFFGGFLAAVAAVGWFSWKHKISFLILTDVMAAPLLLAQSLGRLGCLAAGCCYGKQTDLPWRIVFKNPESLAPLGVGLHPTQLYESMGLFVLFLGRRWLQKKVSHGSLGQFMSRPGSGLVYYLFGYGILRFLIEHFRGDFRGPEPFGFSPAQWISIFCLSIGIVVFIYVQKKRKDSSPRN